MTPPFLYAGQPPAEIPRDVVRVIVAPAVEAIGEGAFENCSALAEVELGRGGGLKTIGRRAFAGCKSLTRIRIPPSVAEIEQWAFFFCERLEVVDIDKPDLEAAEGLEAIGASAFECCTSLQSIRIPHTVSWGGIGPHAFRNCLALTDVEMCECFDKPAKSYEGGEYPGGVWHKIGKEALVGPRWIGEGAFGSCVSLQRVEIPSTASRLERGAFCDCRQLIEVEFAGVRLVAMDDNMFRGCERLASVELPEGLERIGKRAFGDCKSLRRIVLPDGLRKIETGAFDNCTSLQRIAFPSTVEEVDENAFGNCGLETVELPDGLERIGINAFAECRSLRRVTLPSSLKDIGGWAFCGCGNLAEVVSSASLDRADSTIFMDCPSLTSAKFLRADTGNLIDDEDGSTFEDHMLCAQLEHIELCDGRDSIGYEEFAGYRSLNRFRVPSTVNRIDACAFQGCRALVGLEISSEGVERIEESSFRGCISLRSVAIPSQAKTSSGCFEGCIDLLKVLGSLHAVKQAMSGRFDGLPVHSLCYNEALLSRLAGYEKQYAFLTEAAFLLEIALWKSKIDSLYPPGSSHGWRQQCLISSGADNVIPFVLPFLIENAEPGRDETE